MKSIIKIEKYNCKNKNNSKDKIIWREINGPNIRTSIKELVSNYIKKKWCQTINDY